MQLPGRAHRHSTMVEDPASLSGPNDSTWPDLTVQPAGPQLGHPAEPHRRHCACTVRHRLSCAAWLFMGGIESARTPTCLESPHECANRALRNKRYAVTYALRLAVRADWSARVCRTATQQIWTTESVQPSRPQWARVSLRLRSTVRHTSLPLLRSTASVRARTAH